MPIVKEEIRFGDVSKLKKKYSEEEVLSILRSPPREYTMQEIPVEKIKRIYFAFAEDFIRFVVRLESFKLPVFKVVIPCGHTGANFYVVEGKTRKGEKVIAFFRGTYGYGGEGPHQSALVEKFFEILRVPLEVRCGDYLLGLLRIC